MSNRAKGILTGGLLSLLAIVVWIFVIFLLGDFGYFIAGILIGIAFILPYKKICPEDKSKFPIIVSCSIILVSIALSELLSYVLIFALKNSLTDYLTEEALVYMNSHTFGEFMEWIINDFIFGVIIGWIVAYAAFGILLYTQSRRNMRGASGYRRNQQSGNNNGGYNNSGYNNNGNYYPVNSQPVDPFGHPQESKRIDPFADAHNNNEENDGKHLMSPAESQKDSNSEDGGKERIEPADTPQGSNGENGGAQWFDRSGGGRQWFEPEDDDKKL